MDDRKEYAEHRRKHNKNIEYVIMCILQGWGVARMSRNRNTDSKICDHTESRGLHLMVIYAHIVNTLWHILQSKWLVVSWKWQRELGTLWKTELYTKDKNWFYFSFCCTRRKFSEVYLEIGQAHRPCRVFWKRIASLVSYDTIQKTIILFLNTWITYMITKDKRKITKQIKVHRACEK